MDVAEIPVPAPRIVQAILWRRLDRPGHDACALWRADAGWRLSGTAVFVFAGRPCHLAYVVQCDVAWQARSAQVTGWIGPDAVALIMAAVPGGRWRLNGADQEQVTGCADIDLGFTPATNMLPVRRLALRPGDAADAPAAWLSFPELALARLAQHYRRVGADQYAYQAPDVGYTGTLVVSDAGFVTTYPGLWAVEALQ